MGPRFLRTTPLLHTNAYSSVKNFLKELLHKKLAHHQMHPNDPIEPLFKELSPSEVVDGLRHQLEAFWRNELPFKEPVKDRDPLGWWEALQKHPHAQVLAVHCPQSLICQYTLLNHDFQHLSIQMFSVLVNSMPDERTNSTITWFNSPLRGSQNAQTLVDMIQVGQWYRKHQVHV
jgi:hypothetical protein